MEIRRITASELNQWMKESRDIFLVDIREHWERRKCNIGGEHFPMSRIPDYFGQIPDQKPVVFYCHHGERSSLLCMLVIQHLGLTNVMDLEGGIDAWSEEVDPTIPKY